jgi:four helix bundle protein
MTPGHRGLVAWQRGIDLVVAVYSLNTGLRKNRHGELASQLIRAAIAIPGNIAEGKGRSSNKQFAQYLRIATGSLREVDSLLEVLDRLRLVKHATLVELLKLVDETGKALYGLEQKVIADAEA